MEGGDLSVWDKFDPDQYILDRDAYLGSLSSKSDTVPDASRWSRIRRTWGWRALNVAATVFWCYIFLKAFVSDFDRWIVSKVSPSLTWILDFRFFFVLLALTALVVFSRRRVAALAIIYVVAFPLIVIFWKIPRFYYRAQSWNLLIGSLQVIWSIGKSFKFVLFATLLFSFSVIAIKIDARDWVLVIAVVSLLILWTLLLCRAVVYAFTPSQFVVYQERILERILGSEPIWSVTRIPLALKSESVTKLDRSQVDQVVNQLCWGLALYGGSALWAERLEQYKRSGASIIFSAVSVVILVAQALAIFSVVNIGIYKLDESEYAVMGVPDATVFVRYSMSSMFAGEINAISPKGIYSNTISIIAGISCAIVILVLVVSVLFSLKPHQDDYVAEKSIVNMRERAVAFASKLTGEYRLPLKDLMERAEEYGGLAGDWALRLIRVAGVVHERTDDSDVT